MGLTKPSKYTENEMKALIQLYAPTIEGLTESRVLSLIAENDNTGFTESEIIEMIQNNVTESEGSNIMFGSYEGTEVYGENNKNVLTFDRVPTVVFLFVLGTTAYESCGNITSILFGISNKAYFSGGTSSDSCTVSYEGSSMSWYGKSATSQANKSGKTYYYLAW